MITRDRCALQLEKALGVPIENHACMGATIADGLKDLAENEIVTGSLIAIEYGGNDCDLNWEEVAKEPERDHAAKTPLPAFCRMLKQFIKQVRLLGARPLLITPPPLDAQRYFSWVTRNLDADAILSYLGDVQHIYRWQERYAIAVRDVAQQENCEVFDLRDAFLAQRDVSDLICIDGIHPNKKGHALITRAALMQDRRYFKSDCDQALA